MSSNRWVNPVNNNVLRDLEGAILPSGSIEIFEAGTSTPLAVYANPDQTGSLGSVLNCDAYGLIPDFHLPENTQFKVRAYDAQDGSAGAGALQWTRDYLYTSDKSVEDRLTAIEATVNGLSGVTLNSIVNGGMRSATGDDLTLTSSFAEGKVNRVFGRATNVTAGTLTQGTSTDYEGARYAHASGVSLSSAGVVEFQLRIPSGEAARLVDAATIFSCLARQDTGSAVDFTVTVKTPTSTADDFSSLTTIGTDAAQSVTSGTDTRLEFAVADMGDCSKGIAIEISASLSGAITTKNFRIAEAQLEPGATRTAFTMSNHDVERWAARYDQDSTNGPSPLVCGRLAIDGANLELSPHKGNLINIAGKLRQIPSAGVSLSPSGVSNSTLYYIYAYHTGSAVALEYSATAYAISTSNGMAIKSGDATRTLVGMARTSSGGAWEYVRSYFNDPGFVDYSALESSETTGTTSYHEINTSLRTGFLIWDDETVNVAINGWIIEANVSVAFDGATEEDVMTSCNTSDIGQRGAIGLNFSKQGLSEGYHYATAIWKRIGGVETTTAGGSASTAERTTVYVSIGRR